MFSFVASIMGDIFAVFMIATGFGGFLGVCVGLALGLAQGSLLDAWKLSFQNWFMMTAVGTVLGSVAGSISASVTLALLEGLIKPSYTSPPTYGFSFVEQMLFMTLTGLVAGVLLGLSQYSVLRHYRKEAGNWISISAMGWAIACGVSGIVSGLLDNNLMWPMLVLSRNNFSTVELAAISCGLVGGAITGYPLMRALQRSAIQNPE